MRGGIAGKGVGDEFQKELLGLLEEALALDVKERSAFLDERCGPLGGDRGGERSRGRARLRREVERFLAAEGAEDFMEAPAFSVDPNVGRTIGPYELVRRLDRGGMGAVYLARRREPEKKVVLKLVQQGLDHPEILRRFLNEREILAQLVHPHIATLLDGGATDEGEPYFVMDYIEGEPIDRYCDERRLPGSERLRLFLKVCGAVAFAHQHLVVHRDLKPDNILVTQGGEPKLLDFGIAKLLDDSLARSGLTEAGRAPMTRLYASPEQIRGDTVATPSDVYSLGVVLYKLLAGSCPYRFQTAEELNEAICMREPVGPRPSRDPDSIVLKALRKEPERRYGSVDELAKDIRRHLEGWPVEAREDDFVYQSRKFLRRHKLAFGILFLILGFGFFSGFLWQEAVREREQAEHERQRSEAAIDFLKYLFRDADPDASEGEELTAQELLDRAKERLFAELDGDPEMQIGLAGALAEIYRNLGAFDDSRQLMKEAVQLARSHYAKDHTELAKRIANLGVLLYDHGDYKDAEGLFREALAIQHRLRMDVTYSFRMTDNLASVLMLQGEFEEAEKLYLTVFEERKKRYGKDDKDVGTSLRSLGTLEYTRGEPERAEVHLREALRIRRLHYGDEHTRVAAVLDLLGRVVAAQGRREEARTLYDEALRIRRRRYGENDHRVATTKKNLSILLAADDPAAAEVLAREALDVLRRLKPGSWEVADAESVLGACLLALGRYGEAEPYLVESHVVLTAIRGEEAVYSRDALDRVRKLYELWGKPEKLTNAKR